MDRLSDLVVRAQNGDLEAFGSLVQRTQTMVHAVAFSVIRDPSLAQDAAQEAYLRACRDLGDLQDPAGFIGWLRRIVITVALNMRRARRHTFVQEDAAAEVPVLDEAETSWSDRQRQGLAVALLTLSAEERRLCDRRYHGRWSTARLAAASGIDETAMRKRLQRIRDKLRKEIEVAEQRQIRPDDIRPDLPAKVLELLAHPRLTDLPENPVGRVLEQLRTVFGDFTERDLPEVVDLSAAGAIGRAALYIEPIELHRVDDQHILRYDLTLPLLMTVAGATRPMRLWAAGKAYRRCQTDASHLEAFHQADAFWFDERARLDHWQMTTRVLQSVERVLPGRAVKIAPTRNSMCKQAWELEVDDDGRWVEVLAWGVFTDDIVTHVGGDPASHTAIGVGFGLERLAMIRYGVDDIRKIDTMTAA
jgi:RNA polymerase sigma-70 factor (ECF subfamily)